FGPQHGINGQTQANMIEWEPDGHFEGVPVYSLYGKTRKPLPKMLEGLDIVVVDMQDCGSRYYTYIWTLFLFMREAEKSGIEIIVVDRPNPIGLRKTEGGPVQKGFESFVGLCSIPVRHGMTIGETALFFRKKYFPGCSIKVLPMENYGVDTSYYETGLQWVMPSPNMPFCGTAMVYPGMCLLEATGISEGRGTCRPFEIFGAPYIDTSEILKVFEEKDLPGCVFRETGFIPVFDKFSGELCRGFQIHITDQDSFLPLLTGMTVISEIRKMYPSDFKWVDPPYEYEYEKMPIDILTGSSLFRETVDSGGDINLLNSQYSEYPSSFYEEAGECFIYD
ncbi:MAG: DUF1343 domain-containing protein, partial [Fibrobacterota bacterium]